MISCCRLLVTTDDAHIWNILKSKFTSYKDFHTMLYTCAREFDFMEMDTIYNLCQTLLIPTVVMVLLVITFKLVRDMLATTTSSIRNEWGDGTEEGVEERTNVGSGLLYSSVSPDILYNVIQLCAFTVMAVMIMRLKLFFTPHLCLLSSLIASRKLFGFLGSKSKHEAIVVLVLALMSYEGINNLKDQWAIKGEYSNYPLEEMLEWIKVETPPTAVFAGPMPTMAAVKLSAYRPIVNHPHYEDAGLRERTMKVYSMYSRKPPAQVKRTLKSMGINYTVLEDSWCVRRTKPGCSMPELWDIEDIDNRGKTPTCHLLKQNPEPYFKISFKNNVYTILKL